MAKRRFIRVPDPIQLVNPDTGEPLSEVEPVSLLQFVRKGLLHDPRWMASADAVQAAADVVAALRAAEGGLAELDGDDFDRYLKPVLEAPQGGFGAYLRVEIVTQLLPFIRALRGATDTRPSKA